MNFFAILATFLAIFAVSVTAIPQACCGCPPPPPSAGCRFICDIACVDPIAPEPVPEPVFEPVSAE